MRSLPIIALALTCASPTLASDRTLEPDERRCERLSPTITGEDQAPQDGNGAANPEPLLFKAVDQRIEGCSVLVMHRTGELRAPPRVDQRRSLFVPAR